MQGVNACEFVPINFRAILYDPSPAGSSVVKNFKQAIELKIGFAS